MRLIDADKFNEFISNHMDFLVPNNTEKVTQEEIRKFIHNQPTAYDIDKVVEELKDLGNKYCINVGCNYECKDCPHGIQMQKEIEIVKRGGKE